MNIRVAVAMSEQVNEKNEETEFHGELRPMFSYLINQFLRYSSRWVCNIVGRVLFLFLFSGGNQ